jgi:hypothetical protein
MKSVGDVLPGESGVSRSPSRSPRPRSLEEVARLSAPGTVDALLREFLDEYYTEPDAAERARMLAAEPPLAPEPRWNAYLAAVAEHLSFRERTAVPDWATRPERFLKHPYFPSGLESLKATLLVESPTAFRRRMIFVGGDPLYRPRRAEPPKDWVRPGPTS